jgi:hypothetical protein
LPLERFIWSAQFQILFAAAMQVAWMDHRTGLLAAGANRQEFFRLARGECIRFLRQLKRNANRSARQIIPATPTP